MPQVDSLRRQAYQAFFNTRDGQTILADLVSFAQSQDVTESRLLGRADVVMRIERQRQLAKERAKDKEQDDE